MSDLKRFDIQGGQIIAVYEYEEGQWELDSIDSDERYTLSGADVLYQERDDNGLETYLYTDPDGDGIFTAIDDDDSESSSDDTSQPDDDLYRFDIEGTEVVAVYELDDGRWEREFIEFNESYRLDGDQVIKTEVEHGEVEQTIYLARGNGEYIEIESFSTAQETPEDLPSHVSFGQSLSAGEKQDLIELYVTIAGRAPDAGGLRYWMQQMEEGLEIDDIAEAMWHTDDAELLYPRELGIRQMVSRVYENVLSRRADDEGLDYWESVWEEQGAVATMRHMIESIRAYRGPDDNANRSQQLFEDKTMMGGYLALTRNSDDLDTAEELFEQLEEGESLEALYQQANALTQVPTYPDWLIG